MKNITTIKNNLAGILICILIAVPSWILGSMYPVLGGPVIAIISGMVLTLFIKDKSRYSSGIKYTSKKILQYAVVLLGFGLNLNIIIETGMQSLPIILLTISTSLIIAFVLQKTLNIAPKISILVGVGSSICGGSAIAATAPVIDADDEEIAQAISVIFLFNVIAALIFPNFGALIGFSQTTGEAFGMFAGTAINDTSSVTSAASTWDSMYSLGSATLDKAVTVKLTRTLAIIPITMALAFIRSKNASKDSQSKFSIRSIFPFFILYFLGASVITTVAVWAGTPIEIFAPVKEVSKFFIILAMSAIGFNTDIIKLVRTGGKPLVVGFACWSGIIFVSLIMQRLMGMW